MMTYWRVSSSVPAPARWPRAAAAGAAPAGAHQAAPRARAAAAQQEEEGAQVSLQVSEVREAAPSTVSYVLLSLSKYK